MTSYDVTNNGERVRSRLGHNFAPGETVTIELSDSQHRTVKAVRDLDVNVSGDQPEPVAPVTPDDKGAAFESMNVDEAVQYVVDGHLGVDEAVELETAGKGRVTLLEQLGELQAAEQELAQDQE